MMTLLSFSKKGKFKENYEGYRLLLITENEFLKLQDSIRYTAWHSGQKNGETIPLFIPASAIEEVQNVIINDKITATLTKGDMSFSGSELIGIYKSLYERTIRNEASVVYGKIRHPGIETWDDKENIDKKINSLLSIIDNLKNQFQTPDNFLEAILDEEFNINLNQMCREFRAFREHRIE